MNETNDAAATTVTERETNAELPRPNGGTAPQLTDAELDVKNARRLELIEKKYRCGLTAAEASELAVLQPLVTGEIHARYHEPKHTAEELKAILGAIEERLGPPRDAK